MNASSDSAPFLTIERFGCAAGISVWPVPVDAGVLHIGGLHGGDELILLDAMGRVVAADRAASDRAALAINLPTGAYVLRVERDGTSVIDRRVMVVR